MVVIIFILIVIGIPAFYLYRINKVFSMRDKLLDKCSEWDRNNIDNIADYNKDSQVMWFRTKMPSSEAMIWSLKSVKLESWISKERLEKLYSK